MDLNYTKKCVEWEWRLIIKIQTLSNSARKEENILKTGGCEHEYFMLDVEIYQ